MKILINILMLISLILTSIKIYIVQKEVETLKELREFDDEIIEDLQKRLEDGGLDSSIG